MDYLWRFYIVGREYYEMDKLDQNSVSFLCPLRKKKHQNCIWNLVMEYNEMEILSIFNMEKAIFNLWEPQIPKLNKCYDLTIWFCEIKKHKSFTFTAILFRSVLFHLCTNQQFNGSRIYEYNSESYLLNPHTAWYYIYRIIFNVVI